MTQASCSCTAERHCVVHYWRTGAVHPDTPCPCDGCEYNKGNLNMDTRYVTKDSGARETYESGMVRDTQEGKPRFDLLFVEGLPYNKQPVTRLAELLQRGAEKYGERNWQKANSTEELDRFKASAMRHAVQWLCGEDDEDHAMAVVFNIFAAEFVKEILKNNG
jgi:hypothetical protein